MESVVLLKHDSRVLENTLTVIVGKDAWICRKLKFKKDCPSEERLPLIHLSETTFQTMASQRIVQ